MGASLSIDFVTHRFTPSAAPTLKDIDARMESGEMTALIGRSGCGKSTLLHMLAGLLIPSEGCVRVNGQQISSPSAKWNMMFQKASLYPWMTVQENASLGLLFAGHSKSDAYSGEREHPFRLNVNTIFLNASPTGVCTPGVHVQSIS